MRHFNRTPGVLKKVENSNRNLATKNITNDSLRKMDAAASVAVSLSHVGFVSMGGFRRKEPYDSIIRFGTDLAGDCLILRGPRTVYGYRTIANLPNKAPSVLFAHRVAYEKWHGPIGERLQVDHTCHNEAIALGSCFGGPSCIHRACVNPGHLRAVTRHENAAASPYTVTGLSIRRKQRMLRGEDANIFNPL